MLWRSGSAHVFVWRANREGKGYCSEEGKGIAAGTCEEGSGDERDLVDRLITVSTRYLSTRYLSSSFFLLLVLSLNTYKVVSQNQIYMFALNGVNGVLVFLFGVLS